MGKDTNSRQALTPTVKASTSKLPLGQLAAGTERSSAPVGAPPPVNENRTAPAVRRGKGRGALPPHDPGHCPRGGGGGREARACRARPRRFPRKNGTPRGPTDRSAAAGLAGRRAESTAAERPPTRARRLSQNPRPRRPVKANSEH